MKLEIDVHVFFHGSTQLDRIESAVTNVQQQGARTMSVISDFAAKMNEHNTKMDQAVDGLTADIKELNDKIAQLQSTSGQITPEDQALLDAIEAKAAAAADKVAALDNMNPPAVPTDTGGAPQIPSV